MYYGQQHRMIHTPTGTTTTDEPPLRKINPGLERYYIFLFYSELLLLVVWCAFFVWALATDLEHTLELRLLSLHFIAPAAMFYANGDTNEKLEISDARHVNTRPLKNASYVVVTVILLDVFTVIAFWMVRHASHSIDTIVTAIIVLEFFFIAWSLQHLVWIQLARQTILDYKAALLVAKRQGVY